MKSKVETKLVLDEKACSGTDKKIRVKRMEWFICKA